MVKQILELLEYREVMVALAINYIKARYKQTVVGVAWAMLQPLFMMLIFSILFNRFTSLPSEGIPYPIFCLTALIPWTFFNNAISTAISSLVDNESLITKIYFPREILPLSLLFATMIDFFIASTLFIPALLFFKIKITFAILFVIPLFFIQLLLTVGLMLFVAAINVFYRDVRFLIPFLLQVSMFATPIVYSTEAVTSRYKSIYLLNPMAGIIDGYRKVILHGVPPEFHCTLTAFLIALFVFVFGYKYFKYLDAFFADTI